MVLFGYVFIRFLASDRSVDDWQIAALMNATQNVADNIVAGFVFGFFVWMFQDSIRLFLAPDRSVIASHFSDINEFLKYYADAVERYRLSLGDAYVVTFSPLLFTNEYIDYVYRDGAESQRVREAKSRLATFNALMDSIVDAADGGAYDIALLGRTGQPEIDRATMGLVRDRYFKHGKFPGTTELGFHDNLDEYAVFIFGDRNENNPHVAKKYHFVIQMNFTRDFKKVQGFVCHDSDVAQFIHEFQKFRIRESSSMGLFVENRGNDAVETFETGTNLPDFIQKFEEFYAARSRYLVG